MFSYSNLLEEVQNFCKYGIETGIVGESELHQAIPYIFVGNKNGKSMIVQGAIHAREHLTALLVVNLAKFLVKNNPSMLGGIYFVPMVNPDGVRLCQEGVGFIEDKQRKSNLLAINRSTDFSLWKANADGVDLNVNFDANWSEGKQNQFYKGSQNYVGKHPLSAAESRALVEFTQRLNPLVTLSYHLKGEQIYWDFHQKGLARHRDRRYANMLSSYTGYQLVDSQGSVGGYKDWCIQSLGIPAFTIEVGADCYPHPFPYHQFNTIFQQNKDLPRKLLNTIIRDKEQLADAGLADIM